MLNYYVNGSPFRLSLREADLRAPGISFPDSILRSQIPPIHYEYRRTRLSFSAAPIEHTVFPQLETLPMQSTTQPRFLDQVRLVCRRSHFSSRTEEAYVFWIRRFILFHGKRHPSQMGKTEVVGRRSS